MYPVKSDPRSTAMSRHLSLGLMVYQKTGLFSPTIGVAFDGQNSCAGIRSIRGTVDHYENRDLQGYSMDRWL